MPQRSPITGIDSIVIMISDGQLDALAPTFLMSPLRQAMTFEAYLAVKGFGHDVH